MSIALVVLVVRPAAAQETGFVVGQYSVGAAAGAGGINGAKFAYGVRIEKAVAPLEDLGDAIFGVLLVADRYSYRLSSAGHSYRIAHFTISAVANYHLYVENKRWDPFVGLGLGHLDISEKALDFGQPIPIASSAGVFFVMRAGFRYYFTPGIAGYVDSGSGSASLNGGVTFTLK
jgi:hypothetical protein